MANDTYVNDITPSDVEYALWEEEFYLWSSCNDVAELIVNKGYNNVMSIITELVASKYKSKQNEFES